MTVNILVFFNVEIETWEKERRRKRKRTEPLLKWIIFTRKSGFLEGFLMFNPRCWTHLLYGDLCGLIPTFASFPSEVGAQQHTWKPRNCEHTRIKVLARVGGVFLLRGPGWTRVKTGGGEKDKLGVSVVSAVVAPLLCVESRLSSKWRSTDVTFRVFKIKARSLTRSIWMFPMWIFKAGRPFLNQSFAFFPRVR